MFEERIIISAARRQETTEKDDTTGKSSLHSRIIADIEQRVFSGEWPPGHRIPVEYELGAQYQCSRMTVSKALTELVKRGLIERHKKLGSFVRQPQVQSAVLEIHDIPREVQERGLPYRFDITDRRERSATPDDRQRLGLGAAVWVGEISVLHFAGPKPYCFEQRLINLTAVPEAKKQAFSEMPPGSWLIDKVPWSMAEHRIHAANADAKLANMLQIKQGAACLVIERRTSFNTIGITQVRMTYPGDSHELVAQFAP